MPLLWFIIMFYSCISEIRGRHFSSGDKNSSLRRKIKILTIYTRDFSASEWMAYTKILLFKLMRMLIRNSQSPVVLCVRKIAVCLELYLGQIISSPNLLVCDQQNNSSHKVLFEWNVLLFRKTNLEFVVVFVIFT